MDDRRQQIEERFEAALEQPPHVRAAWVDAACAGDPGLAAEVHALLAAHDVAERLFEAPDDGDARVGPYRIIRELGRGGMGVVYLAERADGQFQRRVAIKVIGAAREDDPLHRRFMAERQILAGLDHPHIARMLDGGVTPDGRPYLVLEYVDGVPITAYCDRNRLSLEERLRLFLDVCSAVQHAHQNLVIHRDLKPSNILVTPQGQVRLLDFGIAKLLNPSLSSAAAPVTRTEVRAMTPEYASPEQVRGESLTTASDIYALGVLLYELLTGSSPYRLTTRSPVEIVEMICERDPEPPSTRVTRVDTLTQEDGARRELTPADRGAALGTSAERLRRRLRGDLDSIVMMALRKEPGRRYASADLLRQDLERYLEGLPVLAHRGSRRYRLGKFLRRHRVEAVAAALTLASLLGGLGAALWQARVAALERDRATAALGEAREVADFLLGLFEAGDPTETLGGEVTARELLERGTERADALADQPQVQARMLGVVGRVYRSLGRYERADTLLTRALEIRRGRQQEDAPEAIEDLHALAVLRHLKGEYAPAESLYRAVLVRREARPADSLALARTYSGLARTRFALGANVEADTLYRRAIALLQGGLGPAHPEVVEARGGLAHVLHAAGDYDGAEAILRSTLADQERIHGEHHPQVAETLIQLASVAAARDGDYVRTEQLHRRALEIRERVYGTEHPTVARSMMRVAAALSWQGKRAEAEPLMRRGLEMQRRLLGPRHTDVAASANSLGLLLLETGRVAEAEARFQEALEIYRSVYGPDHSFTAAVVGNLGRVARARGDLRRAEEYARESLAIRRRTLGERHPFVTAGLLTLAGILRERGGLAEAERLLLEAEEHYRTRANARDELRGVRERLVELYTAWNRPEQAARTRALLESGG